jgi:excisionase family DNA binding protein
VTFVADTIDDALLTPDRIAKRLSVSRSWVYGEIRAARLPALYLGRLPRVSERDLAAYLARARGDR